MKLSPRLAAVAELVPCGARVADIGCDHGYLSLHLIASGRAEGCIASDIREGPLSSARANVTAAGQSGRISLRLADGLAAISPEEVTCICIAGMGGDTMREILTAAPWATRGGHALVLQPQSHADTLRCYLSGLGFSIREERIVEDRGHLYCAFRAEWDGKGDSSPLCAYVSPALLSLPREVRNPYLAHLIRGLSRRLAGLSAQGAETTARENTIQALREVSEP